MKKCDIIDRTEYEEFFRHCGHYAAILDERGNFLDISDLWSTTAGQPADTLIGTPLIGLLCGEDSQSVAELLKSVKVNDAGIGETEIHLSGTGGKMTLIDLSIGWNASNNHYYVSGKDITLSRMAERGIALSENFLDRMNDTGPSITYYYDTAEGRLNFLNSKIETLSGYSMAELGRMGKKKLTTLFSEEDRKKLFGLASNFSFGSDPVEMELDLITKNGSIRHLLSRNIPFNWNGEGSPIQILGSAMDITSRKKEEERNAYLANHDSLTGISNRYRFEMELEEAIESASKGNSDVGILFMDLDGFKAINDSKGHDAGDMLLRQIAQRLRSSVRSSDTIARIGGDEFTIIVRGISSCSSLRCAAERIFEVLNFPFDIGDEALKISFSVGTAIYPEDGETLEELLRNADSRMYAAKTAARGESC